MNDLNALAVRELVERALREDIGAGDVTTEAICGPDQMGRAVIRAKEPCVVAGLPIVQAVFAALDAQIQFMPRVREGDQLFAGQALAELEGRLRAILTGERTALNILQRLSGIATLTARYVEAVRDFPVKILDTRKTAPGLRILDKYAVRVGGGQNHRLGLYDGVLIKTNHIRAAGGIAKAIERARRSVPPTLKIEVEVKNLHELQEALEARADIIMLDNMALEEMREAVKIVGGRALLEASGGVTLENVRQIAATGVDFISVGALTHSVKAIDMHLEVLAP
ncbi:MAG: carboxylating nicotinate-nucleotide diphosphorylase [Candidatus Bipolaricaulota bacterium]|nr:carboxylating nicotinate-nucleotide diphosphorylase [Candidatus Bipolaricaulota bacterium]MDW8030770.1 carboxylating nicotinate-nucleotide diphosphorylase [Candidatus Bipolaricaulota bacterium]